MASIYDVYKLFSKTAFIVLYMLVPGTRGIMPGIKNKVEGAFLVYEKSLEHAASERAPRNVETVALSVNVIDKKYITQPMAPVTPQCISSFLGALNIIANPAAAAMARAKFKMQLNISSAMLLSHLPLFEAH